jgi:hypothetical protein
MEVGGKYGKTLALKAGNYRLLFTIPSKRQFKKNNYQLTGSVAVEAVATI